jgi:hypothetical protein
MNKSPNKPNAEGEMTRPNNWASLDAAVASCFYNEADCRRASEPGRWASVP